MSNRIPDSINASPNSFNYEINYDSMEEPIVLSFHLLTLLQQDKSGDLLRLYIFYYYHAKYQKTNQPWCTNAFVAKGLGWGENRVLKAKKELLELGLIENVKTRNEGHFGKNYILVKFVWGRNTIRDRTLRTGGTGEIEGPANGRDEMLKGLPKGSKKEMLKGKGRRTKFPEPSPKPTSKPKPKQKIFLHMFPDRLRNNEQFRQLWYEFELSRKEKHVPLTERAVQLILKTFEPLSIEDVIRSLETTIMNGWRGVFPRVTKTPSQHSSHHEDDEPYSLQKACREGFDY